MKGIPRHVRTDQGIAHVIHVDETKALKRYKCPFCNDGAIDIGEPHLLVIPEHQRLRRHVHQHCLELMLEFQLEIKLFPKPFQKVLM
jgi:hypothetical protein